jgi:hypothetical protein
MVIFVAKAIYTKNQDKFEENEQEEPTHEIISADENETAQNSVIETEESLEETIVEENEIEVVIGDSSELKFSEVEDFVGALKPKVTKKSNIIIPVAKKKNEEKKEEEKK